MNIDLVKIGNFLCELRNRKGLTQEQLASLVGASSKTISKWECGGSFPDVIYQLPLCNALGITLKELQMGCFDIKERINRKLLLVYSAISFITILILVPLFIILLIYFIAHYDKPKIYQLIQDNSSEVYSNVQGVLIESYKHNYLIIDSIDLFDYEINTNDIISVNLYSDNKVIYHKNNLDSFIIDYANTYDINKIKLKLVIEIQELNGNINSYNIPIKVDDNLYASKINSDTMQFKNFNNYNLIEKLKKMGFINYKDDVWKKVIEVDNDESIIYYHNIRKSFVYYYKTLGTYEIYSYYLDYNTLETNIYINGSNNTLIEKFVYHYDNEKLDCQVGLCSSYKNALKIMDEYVSLLRGE